jgi:DNA-binding ferritin-like protein
LLLSLAHRIFIYFSGTGGTKLAQHIRQFFFVNSELKEYFKTIISYAERNKNIVLFELNEIARKDKPNFLAISGFDSYFDEDESSESSTGSVKKPTVVFPHLHKQNMYETMFEEIDRLSEHMRYLNVKPLSSLSRMLEVTQIQEAISSTGAKEMLQELLENNEKFCELMQEISEESEEQKQYATANLVQDLMESHGKFVWMLRSHLQ